MIRVTGQTGRTGGRVVVLGTFDGVHRGHQELLRQGKACAEREKVPMRVITFDRHPLEVILPQRAPLLLNTAEEKERKMAEYGADELRILTFDRSTAETPPEDFLNFLREEQELRTVVAGWNYTFGKQGSGTAEMLLEDGKRHGYSVIIVPSVRTDGGEIISSSAIRSRLLSGDYDGARDMLGYDYPIGGPVVSGKHVGSRIGSPTANIRVPERKLLPAYGVYVCCLTQGNESHEAVVNIGTQPTIPSGGVTVEAHVLDGAPELYGKYVEIRLIRYLRGERRFSSVEALEAQIAQDVLEARKTFSDRKKIRESLPDKAK